ncbi:hypothetical protein GCM10009780_31750 [Actinomadura alba]
MPCPAVRSYECADPEPGRRESAVTPGYGADATVGRRAHVDRGIAMPMRRWVGQSDAPGVSRVIVTVWPGSATGK